MQMIHVTNAEDLQKCFHIRKEVFVNEQGVAEDLEWDEKDQTPDACRHMLLMKDDVPVGTARWYGYDADTAKLQRVAVLKEYRGTGAGKQLILGMEEDARKFGYTFSMLDGQCQAEQFYAKLGYEVISDEPFFDAGILHVRMRKSLT
ncbi:GNAT family N-acetyltransferase [Paenibacillus albiflavus]|uniref:GNAT family N-acetyltransferase n=2 Tax=Paenibacillus albiflavus TaxID=2545760 RepID=A0A4R4DZZ4_9BACL|nr:GNAT family N-acetyltransferase [Paenibacillus albiflavus]TCZ72329.1 GNAT family N-acetyltransferase [Paenibacillus albiflavus]